MSLPKLENSMKVFLLIQNQANTFCIFLITGTENKVFVRFFYLNSDRTEMGPGISGKFQLNDPTQSSAYNQRFRPKQINSFEIWVPKFQYITLVQISIGFHEGGEDRNDVLEDDWGIENLRIHDGRWTQLYDFDWTIWITKQIGSIVLEARETDFKKPVSQQPKGILELNFLVFTRCSSQ